MKCGAALLVLLLACTKTIDHGASSPDGGGPAVIPDIATNCEVTSDSPDLVDAGDVCRVSGEVQRSTGLLVRGVLVMRAGDSLVFSGGSGIEVEAGGQVDMRAPITPSWSAEGWHDEWGVNARVVAAPINAASCNVFTQHRPTDELPQSSEFGSPELIQLNRAIRIEGTEEQPTFVSLRSDAQQWLQSVHIRNAGSETQAALELRDCTGACSESTISNVLLEKIRARGVTIDGSDDVEIHDLVVYGSTGVAIEAAADVRNENLTFDGIFVADLTEATSGLQPHGLRLGAGSRGTVTNSRFVGVCGPRAYAVLVTPRARPVDWSLTNIVAHNLLGRIFGHDATSPAGPGVTLDGFRGFYVREGFFLEGPQHTSFVARNIDLRFVTKTAVSIDTVSGEGTDYELSFESLQIEDADVGVSVGTWSKVDAPQPILLRDVQLNRVATKVRISPTNPALADFVDCALSESDFTFQTRIPETKIRVQNGRDAYALTVNNQDIAVETIDVFYP